MRLFKPTVVALLASLAFVTLPAASEELREAELRNSIVIVNAYDGRQIEASGSGFIVQAESGIAYVVTNARLVADRDSLSAIAPVSGEELSAQAMHIEPDYNFALLKVSGLTGRPLELASGLPAINDVVWSAIKWPSQTSSLGLSRGRMVRAQAETGAIAHTANISGAMGAVLLNDCGQAIGLNVSWGRQSNAIDVATLQALLSQFNIRVTRASKTCVPVMVQAQQQAARASAEAERATTEATRAQQLAEELEARLAASNERNAKLEAEARAARSRADEAVAAAESARSNADETRLELERRTATLQAEAVAMRESMEKDREEAEARFEEALAEQKAAAAQRERLLLIAGGLFLVAAVVVIALLLRNRPAGVVAPVRAKESAAAGGGKNNTEMHKQQDLVEYVLDGRDEDGIRYLLRISGDQLVNNDGVVIGRNPQDSPYIINHADVSRKHARMKVMKDRVFIEDLGSTNGTSVNGQSIDDKGPVSIDNGDQIIIGSVVMKLRVLGA